MTTTDVLPELKQIIGALLFAAREPLAVDTIRKVFKDAARQYEGPVQDFAKVSDKDIVEAVARLNEDLARAGAGIHVGEVANGFRLQNDLNCGIWIRQMLDKGRSTRLSKPALETLAIIAYRQPCTRSEIEAVRGVAVDAIMKNLVELQLVKVTGRSDLPGRPWLFATTRKFLEYFGLKDIQDLPGIEELKRMEKAKAEAEEKRKAEQQAQPELPVGTEAGEAAGEAEASGPAEDETADGVTDEEAEMSREFLDEEGEAEKGEGVEDEDTGDDEDEVDDDEYDDDDDAYDDDDDDDDDDEYDDDDEDPDDDEEEEDRA